LGDPIEIGAASAVLVEGQSRTPPLAVMASKSWLGHSESGAGMVGVAHAMLSLHHSAALGISHLRQVNPYVSSALGGRGKRKPGALVEWYIPRGTAAMPMSSRCGVSSFAFQGTNAHAVMEGLDGTILNANKVSVQEYPWHRKRYYILPLLDRLVNSVMIADKSTILWSISNSVRNSYLFEFALDGSSMLSGTLFKNYCILALIILNICANGLLCTMFRRFYGCYGSGCYVNRSNGCSRITHRLEPSRFSKVLLLAT